MLGWAVGIKELWSKQPNWVKYLFSAIGVVGSAVVIPVINSTAENGRPPDWVLGVAYTIFGFSSEVTEKFLAKTVPLWVVLLFSIVAAAVVVTSAALLWRRHRFAIRQIATLKSEHADLELQHDELKRVSDVLQQQLSDEKGARADAANTLQKITVERDRVVSELKGLKSQSHSTPPIHSSVSNLSKDLARCSNAALRFASVKPVSVGDVMEQPYEEVLDVVMACTKTESYVTIPELGKFLSIPAAQIERSLEILIRSGYVQSIRMGIRPRYSLTAKANKHYLFKGRGRESKLTFDR